MKSYLSSIALGAAVALACMQGVARAEDCSGSPGAGTPCTDDNDVCTTDVCDAGTTCLHNDTCTELTGAGKNGGFFRMKFPANWDGDLVVINHGFDLNDKKIRPHHVCSENGSITCNDDSDCPSGFCNEISFLGLDQYMLGHNKAVAASTYAKSGWAVFSSAKDIKDMLKFVKKDETYGANLKRTIVTGFSLGGAVTGDAILKLKIDGAVPLCAAVGGGLPTWDVAVDVRLIYDYLCDGVSYPLGYKGKFESAPDVGEPNPANKTSDEQAQGMALTVDSCLGIIGFAPHNPGMDQRLRDFITLTGFSGYIATCTGGSNDGNSCIGQDQCPGGTCDSHGTNINLASAMGFATLGLGDFVLDPDRLGSKRIGWNSEPDLDYAAIGNNTPLAVSYNAGVERLTAGKGRKTLTKYSYPDFTKGKGAKVSYPIMEMSGANDWLVIPEFERVFDTALDLGSKSYTRTWTNPFGHCVFTEQEITALFDKYFEWLGPDGGPQGTQPTKVDVANACLALPGGVDGDTCNFNNTFVPGYISDRIPIRGDWPPAAQTTSP